MSVTFVLTDNTTSESYTNPSPPLTESIVEGATDVVTMDNNMSTYFTANKRVWTHTWAYMSKADFDIVKGFYDRQWTEYKYPLFTCSILGVSAVPCRMSITPRKVIDSCEAVQDVTIALRESAQMGA